MPIPQRGAFCELETEFVEGNHEPFMGSREEGFREIRIAETGNAMG